MLLLGEILRRHAADRGDKLAYVLGGARVSYREMNSRANRIAHLLRERGVGRGDRVAVLAGNVPLYPECYFAAAKLGAILVPVNARHKEAEVEYAVTQSESKVLIHSGELAALVDALRAKLATVETVLSLDAKADRRDERLAELLASARDDEPRAEIDENDPHVMLYTSGTTGNPKGVLSSHRAYVLAAAQSQSGLRLGEEDVGVSMFPMFHMGGWALPLGLWWSGATAVIMPKADPEEILRTIERERATYFYGIPTVLSWMLDSPGFSRFDLSSLRLVASGTSAMTAEQVLAIHHGFPHAGKIVIYGSTEAGPVAMLRPPDLLRKPTSVGRPALNVDVRLVDGDGCEVRAGEAGEIVCRSEFLMLGYWKMPEATREVLRDGWYSSGDLAARDDEGFIHIAGRVKDMIKTGGENVFPAEVENVLLTHPSVREVAVFGVPDPVWGESVVAAVVPNPGAAVSAEDVVGHVAARLAGFKKPRWVLFVEGLPRTAATGRVQKPLLRERFLAAKRP
ncbi:MAG: long-chain-fatty-acid--CoA ligase [Candidatus Binatia bacterium]